MVEIAVDAPFDFREIDHHTVAVEFARAAIDGYRPIVAVQSRAFALIGQVEAVTARYLHLFNDVIHIYNSFKTYLAAKLGKKAQLSA